MPIITEVRFAHEEGALADTLGRLPDHTVSIVQETGTDPEGNLYFVRVEGEPAEDVETILEADASVSEVKPMPGFAGEGMWGVSFAPGTRLMAPRVTSGDGFVLEARSTSNADWELRGWRERWLLPDREALQDIWQYAREEGFEFDVLEFRRRGRVDMKYAGLDAPTEEQREALVAAYDQGYFAEPREASLAELAESLGLSPTAVAGRLRRGMKATIEMTLVADDPPE
jgi:hypothetical protein